MKKILMVLFIILALPLSLFTLTANASTSYYYNDYYYDYNYQEPLGTVTLTNAEVKSPTSVSLSWENDSYSYYHQGYKIYRATSKSGKYSLVEKINYIYTTSYTDENLATGKKYYYKVCQYNETYDNENGDFSNIKSVTPLPAKISFNAVAYDKNKVSLTWNQAEDGVDGYVIYRATSKNGKYKSIKRITKCTTTSYTDTGAKYGKFYYYKMKAYTKVNGQTIYGKISSPVRNKVDISLCQPYFIKIGNIESNDSYEMSKYIRIKYGDDILTTDDDYTSYVSGWGSNGGILTNLWFTVYSNEGNYTGSYTFQIDTINKKTQLMNVGITNSGIEVKWFKESGALGYKIYRKTGNGSYSLVKTITDNNADSWTDKSAKKLNTKYTYYVKAYTKSGSKYKYANKSDALSVKRIGTPKLKGIVNKKEGIVLKWNAVKGAKNYDILRKTGNGDWEYISNTTSTEYIDTNTTIGNTYTYTVCCDKGINEQRISYYNQKGLKKKRTIAIEGKSQSSDSVKITWNKAPKANGYAIYRATSKNGAYKKIKTIKSKNTLSFTDKNLTFAKYYYYKVRPYTTKNGKTVYGDYGTVAKTRPILGVVTVKKPKAITHTKVKLSWLKLPKADGYHIYQCSTEDGTYKRIKTVNGNSTTTYTVTKLENAHTYYFKIKGYRKLKGTMYNGDFSSVKSCFIDVLGYEAEWYSSKANRIWGSEYYKDYPSAKAAKKDMKTIKIKTWDINSSGKKYTRYHYLTVHKNIVPTVKQIFIEIYNGKEKFPIKSIGGYSWRGDNSPSEHCEGLAIDINPNENAQFNGYTGKPMVGSFWKPGKNPYSITADGDVVRIFRKYGFGWGYWFGNPDYMHFSYFGT